LTRKDWDKDFNKEQEIKEVKVNAAFLSEKEDLKNKRMRERQTGKVFWSSLAVTSYAALYIILVL
jgi:hypothetical protein